MASCAFCPNEPVGHMACKYCAELAPFCQAHVDKAHTAMAGHAFQQHPESLPDEEWAELMGSPEALKAVEAAIEKASVDDPTAWTKVKAFIAARKKS